MTYDYVGSIAQKYILFVTTVVLQTTPGANFYAVEVFIDSADSSANFAAAPATDTITTITAQTYKTLLTGSMLAWMTGFYSVPANIASLVYLVTFTNGSFSGSGSTSVDLGSQYAVFNQYGYWKLAYSSAYKQQANQQLASLSAGDPLSQFVFGSNDGTFLTGAVGTEANWFKSKSLDVPFIYHWNTAYNPALVQLGATLATVNGTGTPVGNKTDFLAIGNGFGPSGSGSSGVVNLTPAQYGYAQGSGISFFTYVGDGSGNVAAEKWTTMISKTLIGATWLVNYIDTVASQLTASYITATAQSGFNNNDTYQGVLNILTTQLNLFGGIGRLMKANGVAGADITAPPFNKLPPAAGGVITVPNAWSATYVDNLRQSTIYGTLYIKA
jgi:hypothetical protein